MIFELIWNLILPRECRLPCSCWAADRSCWTTSLVWWPGRARSRHCGVSRRSRGRPWARPSRSRWCWCGAARWGGRATRCAHRIASSLATWPASTASGLVHVATKKEKNLLEELFKRVDTFVRGKVFGNLIWHVFFSFRPIFFVWV